MGKDGSRNNDVNDGCRCRNCGSNNMVQDVDRGEVLCDDCGVIDHLDNLDISGHVRFGDGSQNSEAKDLGSTFNTREASKGVRAANKRSQKGALYMQELFELVDEVVPEGRMRDGVKDLLKSYDENDSFLWRKRRKLNGGKDPLYRKKVLVAGALAALHKSKQHNQANVIALRWDINHKDLVFSTTTFRRFMLRDFTTPNKEDILRERKEQLYFHLEKYREILAERVGWQIANQVLEGALDELAENFEPVYDSEDSEEPIQSTKYGTKSSESAAWESFMKSMMELGMGADMIGWLHSRAAPSSVGNLTREYTKEAKRRAALSDGSEEE